MLDQFASFVSENIALSLVFVCILILLSLGIGYIVGNNTLNHKVDEDIDKTINKLKYDRAIRASIIDNVNLGVLAYNSEGLVYNNHTVLEQEQFIGKDKKVPATIEAFLDRYAQENNLKSNYLLNIDNNDSVMRANYINDRKIYEIKVLHKVLEGARLDIIIIDDITQVKDDERRQKDLAANVSHELKTPLTVIRASEFFVNNITPDRIPSYEELKKWGTRIIANAVRMQDIVQDFLILSMCSQNVQMTIIDIGETVTKAVNNLNDYPGRDKVEIRLPEQMYYPLVFGNSNLIMRVVINLLTNAVKYIGFEGKTEKDIISVEIQQIGERIGIQVSDNGRGIPEKDIDHLFERFFRVDNSGSRDVGGSGIGLAIAKDIADMHDGTINVVSKLGQGSTFTFILPQAAGVFESVFEDAKTGVVSESPYYRGAADFMAIQAIEAVRSMGYDDALEEAEALENSGGEKTARDKKLVELLNKIGEERYTDLVDELTYIEPEGMDDDFDDFEEDSDDDFDAEEEIPEEEETDEESADLAGDEEDDEEDPFEDPEDAYEAEEPVARSVRQAPSISADLLNELEAEAPEKAQSEAELQLGDIDKEEARKLLTQQILPRAVPQPLQNEVNSKERVTIHPIKDRRMYNSNANKVLDDALSLGGSAKEPEFDTEGEKQ